MKLKICGIYKITSPSGKIYIGQSTCIKTRWASYKRKMNAQIILKNSIKKYGWEAHIFEIIKECVPEKLNELEVYYIKFYDTFNTKHGLNSTSGGNSKYKLSKEQIKQMSESRKGTHKGSDNPMFGKPRPDVIERNKKGKGKKHSDEYKAKMSISVKNRSYRHSLELLKKMSEFRKNFKYSEEGKKNISEGLRNREIKYTDYTKKSLSNCGAKNGRFNKVTSEETRNKIKNSQQNKVIGYIISPDSEWFDLNHKKIRIAQLDKDGKLIKIWNNIKEISLNLNYKASTICGCLGGRSFRSMGYIWKYAMSEGVIDPILTRYRKCAQYTLNMELIAIFSSCKEASLATGIQHIQIHNGVKGKQKTVHGFIFKSI